MTTPRTDRLLSFDLETTGADPNSDRIVTSSLVTLFPDGTHTAVEHLADPGIPIPDEAAAIHGITTEHARAQGRDHSDVLADTVQGLREAWADGVPVVVFNAAFDLSMLAALDPTFTVDGPVIDPLVLDKLRDPYRKGPRRLVPLAAHYGVDFDESSAHNSSADSVAAGLLARSLLTQSLPGDHRTVSSVSRDYAGIDCTFAEAAADTDLLMDLQTRGRRASMNHLREYFDSVGKQHDGCDGGWPIQDSTLANREGVHP